MKYEKIIFVSGHARGGTTWLGQLFTLADHADFLFEPLTFKRHPQTDQIPFLSSFLPSCGVLRYNEARASGDTDAVADTRQHIKAHVDQLCSQKFSGKNSVLVIKQPNTEAGRLIAESVDADDVVYIRRNFFSILNSYEKSDLLRGWNVERQFDELRELAVRHFPSANILFEEAGNDPALKLAALYLFREQLVAPFFQDRKLHRMDYEDLASQQEPIVERLFSNLGLVPVEQFRDRAVQFFRPESAEKGFLDVHKASADRASAYLRELPASRLRETNRYMERVGHPKIEASQKISDRLSGRFISLSRIGRRGISNFRSFGGRLKQRVMRSVS